VETQENRIDKERAQLEAQLKKRRDEFIINIEEVCDKIKAIPTDFETELMKDDAV